MQSLVVMTTGEKQLALPETRTKLLLQRAAGKWISPVVDAKYNLFYKLCTFSSFQLFLHSICSVHPQFHFGTWSKNFQTDHETLYSQCTGMHRPIYLTCMWHVEVPPICKNLQLQQITLQSTEISVFIYSNQKPQILIWTQCVIR